MAIVAAAVVAAGSAANAQVLHDNGPLITHPLGSCTGLDASALQNTSQLLNVYGFGWTVALRLADDFVVPAGEEWDLTGFEFFAYLTNSAVPSYTTATIEIWNGRPGDPGSAIIAGDAVTNRITSATTFTSIYRPLEATVATECIRRVQRIQCSLATTLTAGTYWISINGGPAGFMPPVTILGANQKPGSNARQFNGAWVDLLDNGLAATIQDIPFLVLGTKGGNCYADCNLSGTLTVADFGCFQGKYVLGDMYADCNASGTLTVADFGCFQGKYVLGCP
ncbi:MAG: hypothetical protein ACKVU4_11780 [Phycisphaerales bacterium]